MKQVNIATVSVVGLRTLCFGRQVPRIRSLGGAAVLSAAIVAVTMGPAPAAVAQQNSHHQSRQSAQPKYVFETLFDVRHGATEAFDRYWAALKESSSNGVVGPLRFVDGEAYGAGRRITLPVTRLAEYGFDRRNEAVLRAKLGDDAAGVLIQQFNEAQLSRASYLRQFRDDLSVRREQHARTAATEVTFVTVSAGREPAFERAWRRGSEALARTDPAFVATVARTLVGGGPQFVIARPANERVPRTFPVADLVAAVGVVFGEDAALDVAGMFEAAGTTWRTVLYRNLGYDTMGGASSH
jgi:hypothetical protein